MCVVTDAAVTAVLTAVNMGLQIKKAIESKVESDYQADIQLKQAKQAENEAKNERQEGIEEARRNKLQSILKMGNEKAALASSNISLSSATALNILDDEEAKGELDALATLNNSEKRADSYMRQSQRYYEQASLTSSRGMNNFVNSIFGSMVGFGTKNKKTIVNLLEKRKK